MISLQVFGAALVAVLLQNPAQAGCERKIVHRIDIVGTVEEKNDRNLRGASQSIEEGKPYTSKALDLTIKRINKLGSYKKITRADCSVVPSRSSHCGVEIEIRVRPR